MPAIETEVFAFDELWDAARDKARERYRQGHLDYDCWDTVYSDFEAICGMLGIALKTTLVTLMGGGIRRKPCIYFRGFSSQGDGASFEIECYAYARGSLARFMAHAPKDEALHAIARRLADIQRRNFYRLHARAEQRGFYCHEHTMQIDVRRDNADMTADAAAGERAVTAAMREAGSGLKTAWRLQITGAGLGARLANSIRSQTFPRPGESLDAAALVWSKAPVIVGAHETGPLIRSKNGFWLAIALPAAGKSLRGGRITPGEWERRRGLRLRFVYRRTGPAGPGAGCRAGARIRAGLIVANWVETRI